MTAILHLNDKNSPNRRIGKVLHTLLILVVLAVVLPACSLEKFVIRQTGALLDYGMIAFYEEDDLTLAETALASNIKLLEGMVKGDPENEHLLILTSQALSGYALGFAEDTEPERAKSFYLRAREYGLRVLRLENEFLENEKKPLVKFAPAVEKLDKDHLDALFWTAFAWAGWINLNLNEPRALIDLPKVEAMMQRVLNLDERYFHGGAHLFFGSMWGTKPRMLGGDPEKAKEHFETNLTMTAGNFLLTYVYYARFYAAKTLNEALFTELLDKVEQAPDDILPDYRLLNEIAKEKARRLMAKRADLF